MKFGVREITDVVFRGTSVGQKLGNRTTTAAYQPLLFLESAKTSTIESAVATVYAQGGRGNPRLLAWDGDKTVTFTFEDALMSASSFAALSGADLSNASSSTTMQLHLTDKASASLGSAIAASAPTKGGSAGAYNVTLTVPSGHGLVASTSYVTVSGLEVVYASTAYAATRTYDSTAKTATVKLTFTSASHGISAGTTILVAGAAPSAYNGLYTVSSVSGADVFYVVSSTTDPGAFTTQPTSVTVENPSTVNGVFLVTATTATTITYGSLALDPGSLLTNNLVLYGPGTLSVSVSSGTVTNADKTYVKVLRLDASGDISSVVDLSNSANTITFSNSILSISGPAITAGDYLVDYYVQQSSSKLEISAEKFAGYYYLEANTLFRGTDGKDYPAQFTVPKAKIQSNFTFAMAPTGDPSTFTFTLDAFPAPTRFDSTGKKVLFALDIADASSDVI